MHALSAIGSFHGLEHHFGLRVYFEDTDLTGVVYHANYLRYMERARSDMLLAAGVDQRTTFESGEGAYALRGVRLDYRVPARLGEELNVVSRLVSLRAAAVVIQQRVMRGETIVAAGEVEAAFVSPTGRPRRQPAAWIAAFEPLLWKGN
ncbi:MAG: YbgC/FadM family acyl-CoA thioesterase [Sphingomonas sp.]|uniref:YbgC/FadM family acyl-CoA thioesterase n=1 Tax=Sphingomonas sp. TaxID=28214 RepID=UPI0022723AEF|nr:YbgC/FadM family acyl-CoA thioesterase [Sphingomonas sp.]MCX8475275.1 YbgC/FadM family acyl-CoA thioesterase [Sphingomonas sp.]